MSILHRNHYVERKSAFCKNTIFQNDFIEFGPRPTYEYNSSFWPPPGVMMIGRPAFIILLALEKKTISKKNNLLKKTIS